MLLQGMDPIGCRSIFCSHFYFLRLMGHMLAAILYEIYSVSCVCVMSQFLSQPLATLQPTHYL